jgi:hypothetical protein
VVEQIRRLQAGGKTQEAIVAELAALGVPVSQTSVGNVP